MTDINRRQFPRISLSDEAVAMDPQGLCLGRVKQASGGGMSIEMDSAEVREAMKLGKRLTVTILEPGLGTSNTLDVVVRHRLGNRIGVEFVSGPEKP